ncbi:fimbrial biogenesis chaperone [Acinetobacter sp. CAAS 2-6]|uniref:fimbrial biogenesis chaperone n=1 Tax=Acinetobacter sp. CAAS 2-6 TaxID=3016358 RepID=UPI002DD64C94|nr:fimbria/pilus periplasmic chaperone [Acinetobacter sp. CAAS 2-6]
MNRFSYSLFVLCGIIFFHQQGYAAIAIEPVQLYLSDQAKQRSTTLTFDSKREKISRNFEVKAVKWTQNEQGQDIYEVDPSIMINPKAFILKPDSKQMIRVGFNRPIASLGLKKEMSWRIVFTEIPSVIEESGLNFAFNISVPLFVGKQSDINIQLKIKKNNRNSYLNIYNIADSHIQIKELSILDQSDKEVFKLDSMRYLLSQSQVNLELGDLKIGDWNKYTVLIKTDKEEKGMKFKIME